MQNETQRPDGGQGHEPVKRSHRPVAVVLQWIRDLILDRVVPNLQDFWRDRQLLVWLLALLIGAGSAYLAIGFRLAIGFIQLPWLGTVSEQVFAAASEMTWWQIMLGPMIGGLLVGLFLQYMTTDKRVHGVADVIEARALLGCKIPARVGITSAIVSAVSLGLGASAGREGPVVHMGATLASVLESYFKLPAASQRALLAAGVAAAVTASFNAPMAGVLFAHEVILGHYALRAFVPIVISSVVATVISRIHLGDFPAFIIPEYQITSYWEFPAFALLGLVCAAVAIGFLLSVMAATRISQSVQMPLWLRPVLGGVIVGAIAIWFPHILGVGYDATDAALKQQLPLWMLLGLLVAKTVATAITLASRFGGGVFSPSLYLGAMAGGAFGLIAENVFPIMTSSQGLYAIVGMGAVAAGVLGAPISTTLIVFELTGGYEMTIALLLAVSISSGLTQAVYGQSFFHWQLTSRGIFLQGGPHKSIVRNLRVDAFMKALAEGENPEPFKEDGETSCLKSDDTVETALRAFDRTGCERIAVVASDDSGRIIAWADRVDALDALNDALIAAHEEEHR